VVQALLRLKDLQKNNIDHYMLVGNHDMANPNSSMNSILFVFNDYAKIISDYYYIDTENTRIHMLSYTNNYFENFILAEDKKNILIGHLDIIGFVMPNGFVAKSGFRREDFKDFDLVISGHYHKHQVLGNIVYVGSPYQTSVSEREQQHGFVILDTDTLEWKLVEYQEAPKYKMLEVKHLTDIRLEDISNNFVRIKLASHKISKVKLKSHLLELGALSVDIIPPEDVKEIEKYYDSEALSDEPTEIAAAYLNSLKNIKLDKRKLIKYFTKIEEVATNIIDYEI
jgi:DNA repair exonuclease SbcCD nuclease subunit